MGASKITYLSLDTPCALLSLDKLEVNIKEMSCLAEEAVVLLRPHIKIHQSAFTASLQIESGACGIEVGTIDQAEVFANEGFKEYINCPPFLWSLKIGQVEIITLSTKP